MDQFSTKVKTPPSLVPQRVSTSQNAQAQLSGHIHDAETAGDSNNSLHQNCLLEGIFYGHFLLRLGKGFNYR